MTINTTPNLALPWPANDEPVTNGWDAIRDLAVALDDYLALGYTTFAPQLLIGAAEGPYSMQNGRWRQRGKEVHVQVAIVGSATLGGGADYWTVTLPVAPRNNGSNRTLLGSGFTSSAGGAFSIALPILRGAPSAASVGLIPSGASDYLKGSFPAGTGIGLDLTYEAA